jgi:hypothetical protein
VHDERESEGGVGLARSLKGGVIDASRDGRRSPVGGRIEGGERVRDLDRGKSLPRVPASPSSPTETDKGMGGFVQCT